jgi:hypothetical protein
MALRASKIRAILAPGGSPTPFTRFIHIAAAAEIEMDAKLFGVPLVLWGALCLVLTVIWIIIWPSDKANAVDSLRFFILRWFHALVWLLLAIAAFLAAFNLLGGASTARMVAFLSLITYLVFMVTFTISR